MSANRPSFVPSDEDIKELEDAIARADSEDQPKEERVVSEEEMLHAEIPDQEEVSDDAEEPTPDSEPAPEPVVQGASESKEVEVEKESEPSVDVEKLQRDLNQAKRSEIGARQQQSRVEKELAEARSTIQELETKVKALEDVRSLIGQSDKAQESAQAQAGMSDADMAEMIRDYPGAQKLVDQFAGLQERLARYEETIQKVQSGQQNFVQSQAEREHQAKVDRFYADMDSLSPGWLKTRENPDFQQWIGEHESGFYLNSLQSAERELNSLHAAVVYQAYENHIGQSQKPVEAVSPGPSAATGTQPSPKAPAKKPLTVEDCLAEIQKLEVRHRGTLPHTWPKKDREAYDKLLDMTMSGIKTA